jgi:hypothetical protein
MTAIHSISRNPSLRITECWENSKRHGVSISVSISNKTYIPLKRKNIPVILSALRSEEV